MHAHSSYRITIDSSGDIAKKAFSFVVSKFSKSESDTEITIDNNNVIVINDTYDYVFLDEIVDFAKGLNKFLEGILFRIEGMIDTSESAGEYMDFKIQAEGKKITVLSSPWYTVEDINEYECAEEFNDEFDMELSEKKFKKLLKDCKGGPVFILEGEDDSVDVVTEVPLSDMKEIPVE